MPGLLDGIGHTLGALASLPGAAINSYAQTYAAVPQQLADAAQQRQFELQSRQMALKNAQYLQGLLPSLSPQDQIALLTNAAKLGESYAANDAPQKLSQGETAQYYGPHGPQVTAPLFDSTSGRTIQMGPGATQQVSANGAGGDYSAAAGLILGRRDGNVSGTYSTPEQVPLTSRPGSFTPTVSGPGGAPAQMPPLPPGIPTPDQIPGMFPGAQVTSGYRTPQHNADVGGVPGSMHMTGTPGAPGAIDLVPPPGLPMSAFAANVRQKAPTAKVINEGDHVHMQGQPGAASNPAGWSLGQAAPQYGPRTWNPQTGQYEQVNNATGQYEGVGRSVFDPQKAKADLVSREQYTNYTSANDAFKAMLAAAALPNGGMRAYALRDTFARLINPGAVARVGTIQAIEQAQGVPANIKAYLMNLKGDGNVPPEIAQQILDVSHGFLGGHHQSAKALNDSYAKDAVSAGFKAEQATAPMEDMPGNVHLMPPKKEHVVPGDIYKTPRGMMVYNGQGFLPYGR